MAAVKSKGNKSTERAFRMFLVRNAVAGFHLNYKALPGTPDFYFPEHQLAIFIDGCFWHGCPTCGHVPKTRQAWWRNKLQNNHQRDVRKTALLEGMGIKVVRLWEHDLKDTAYLTLVLRSLGL